ncbi:hypothetical protein T4B_6901 [Trichinella pseudospiralis]|uniref:Uncharacterized protein n=1 Tax=Trichinella pseudospiralis TaxID=6337 RepID=A0A0V1JRW1_TRIPS|nr:hypothetical protein T4B_6901 [Trichinella pseudospiralis]KRZ37737.1 hypothetical protein T4C_2536 [Trichinella pseudospiralis]
MKYKKTVETFKVKLRNELKLSSGSFRLVCWFSIYPQKILANCFQRRSQVHNIMSRESYLRTEKHVSKRKRIPADLQGLVERNDFAAKSMMDEDAAMRRKRI